MHFDISDREREQLSKMAAKAAAAYMDVADGLNENDMFKTAFATMRASIIGQPLTEQLADIYVQHTKGASSD